MDAQFGSCCGHRDGRYLVWGMSPIEAHWQRTLAADLERCGVTGAAITVQSAQAEEWRFGIAVAQRVFEIGFNHRDQFWARETTIGREKHLTSNDHRRIPDSAEARRMGAKLVGRALSDPSFPPRDPDVI